MSTTTPVAALWESLRTLALHNLAGAMNGLYDATHEAVGRRAVAACHHNHGPEAGSEALDGLRRWSLAHSGHMLTIIECRIMLHAYNGWRTGGGRFATPQEVYEYIASMGDDNGE